MKNSNIDVDIIDETLLYICIDGKREHISYDNARIKYAKNAQVLTMIDDVLTKYKENLEPLKDVKEEPAHTNVATNTTHSLKDLNDKPLEAPDFEIDLGASAPKPEPSLKDLNSKPLEAPIAPPAAPVEPVVAKKPTSLKDLRDAPLELVDEAKFASIYSKYNSRIRETFPTDSPSFLDVEKLARNSKPLEQVR